MNKVSKKEALAVLKSGNFSIHYHDNGSGSIYRGRFDYDKLQDKEGNDANPGEEILQFDNSSPLEDGYVPGIVKILVEALGGKTGSA